MDGLGWSIQDSPEVIADRHDGALTQHLKIDRQNGNRTNEFQIERPDFPEQALFRIGKALLDLLQQTVSVPDPGRKNADKQPA